MKQGKEDFKLVKDSDNESKRNYIFQNNTKTKAAFYFVAFVLVILIVAVTATAYVL
ncbi:hypothetical protein U8527_04155 [Kordia algicida OT-1]|uniref:Uncharacterized protein n=1 Tax=Kordia algicida OT-1 TaxID=391587 RepID=A9DPT3_9FLAO|nr:hypothetical protein [Kordia algicida]EDP97514.1 hypothetical protein KAOT1_20167 [Kordia algicida OT-1]